MQKFDKEKYPNLVALDEKVKAMLTSEEAKKWGSGERLWRIAKTHPVYWIEEYGYIRPGKIELGGDSNDLGSRPIRFVLNPVQLQIANKICAHLVGDKYSRIQRIDLKFRKAGISTLLAAFDYWFMRFNDNFNAMVVADLSSHSDNIVEMVKMFHKFDTCGNDAVNPKFFVPRAVPMGRSKKGFKMSNGSMLEQETGENDNPGTSQTLNLLHMSESSKWRNPDDAETSLLNSVPRTGFAIIFKESTAFGINKFARDCEEAWSGKSAWEFNFISWLDMPDCCDDVVVGEITDYTTEEKELLSAYPKMNIGHIKFRRRQIELLGSLDKFRQDFPLNPREPFLVTGANFFNIQLVRDRIETINFYRDMKAHGVDAIAHRYPELMMRLKSSCKGFQHAVEQLDLSCVVPTMISLHENDGSVSWLVEENGRPEDGHATMFLEPNTDRRYLVVADPAEGKSGADYTSDDAIVEVYDCQSMEQVLEWGGCFDEEMTAVYAVMIAKMYNEALLAFEINNKCGGTLLSEIKKTGYGNIYHREMLVQNKIRKEIGWQTKTGLKKDMIAQMRLDFKNQNLTIHSLALLEEMMYFVEKGVKLEAAEGKKDDRILASAIAVKIINISPGLKESVARKPILIQDVVDSYVEPSMRPSKRETWQQYM